MISLLLPLLGVVLPSRLMDALVVKLYQRQNPKQLLRRMSCDPYLQLWQQQQLPQLDNLQQLGCSRAIQDAHMLYEAVISSASAFDPFHSYAPS